MKNIGFHREAEEYYDSKSDGLGIQFWDEVEAGLRQMAINPYGWPLHAEQILRYLLHRFPYALLFQIYADQIYILAIMHLHREPNYWRHRLNS